MVDIPVRIGARSDFDKEDAGIILTTNRLADYLRAVNLSRILFERIQQLQMITVIYHVFIITVFGFLLPAANIPLLPALSAVCGLLLVIFILTRTKQEIS
jgi:cation transport ATPase